MEIYRGKRLSIETREVILPSGTKKERVVIHPGGAVAILPVEGDDCYLIRQYRFAIADYILEAPAGTIDEGEEPIRKDEQSPVPYDPISIEYNTDYE